MKRKKAQVEKPLNGVVLAARARAAANKWTDAEREKLGDEFCLKVRMEPLEEGGFLATSPDLPGLVAQGRTRAEAMEIAQDVARRLIDSHLEHGDPLPLAVRHAIKNRHRVSTVTVPVGLSPQPA